MGRSPERAENPVASRPPDRRRRQSPPDPRPNLQKHALSSLEGCLSCPTNGTATPIERDKSANSSKGCFTFFHTVVLTCAVISYLTQKSILKKYLLIYYQIANDIGRGIS